MRLHFNIRGKADIVSLDIPDDETLDNLRALLEVSSSIPVVNQVISLDGRVLSSSAEATTTVASLGVSEGNLLSVDRAGGPNGGSGAAASGSRGGAIGGNFSAPGPGSLSEIDPNVTLRQLGDIARANRNILGEIRVSNPQLADAIESPNYPRSIEEYEAAARTGRNQRQREMAELQAQLDANPWDPELQKKLEEMIRLNNVEQNLAHAMEHNPEAFGSVVMLYVDAVVNDTPVKAFVDSGAQSTIMSEKCAERCGIMRLIDTRFAGVAKGVGSAKIIGRVHMAPIKIGNSFFYSSFTVLEGDAMDFLLGLDFLSKHQCVIDLRSNPRCLRLGESESVSFLQETDLPLHARGTAGADAGDGSSNFGGSFGATGASSSSSSSSNSTSNANSNTTPSSGSDSANANNNNNNANNGSAGNLLGQDPAKVKRLMELGTFTEMEVAQALKSCNGNEEHAAGLLFGGF